LQFIFNTQLLHTLHQVYIHAEPRSQLSYNYCTEPKPV